MVEKPEWTDGVPANLAAAATDALEWLRVLERLDAIAPDFKSPRIKAEN